MIYFPVSTNVSVRKMFGTDINEAENGGHGCISGSVLIKYPRQVLNTHP